MKKLIIRIVALFATTMLANSPLVAQAVDSTSQFDISPNFYAPMAPGYIGYQVYGALSIQAGLPIAETQNKVCNQPDTECLKNAQYFHMNGYFKDCKQTTNSPCVESIEARVSPDSPWLKGDFVEEISYKPSQRSIDSFVNSMRNTDPSVKLEGMDVGIGWPYQSDTGLPASAEGPLVFRIPGVANAGGTETYVVDSRFEISSPVASGKIVSQTIGNLVMSIRPTKILTGQIGLDMPVRGIMTRSDGSHGTTGAVGGSIDRSFATETTLGSAKAFGNQTTEFRLNVLLPKTTVGWFHGRLIEPNIDIKASGANQIAVSVTGKPTQIPIASVWLPTQSAVSANPNLINPHWDAFWRDRVMTGKTSAGDEWNGFSGLDERFTTWFPYLPKQALGTANLWMVNTLPADQTASRCFKNAGQLVGLLTTNSMAYQAGPPTFTNGQLNYKVAGVHLDSTGSVYSGTYDLIIKSEVARCLYGFNQAPISATISVVDTENGSSAATTLMSERDGWVRFEAKNFTFSTKEVRVKISQPKYQTIAGFAKNKANITPTMKTAIKRSVTSATGSTFTCVGYYSKANSKELAKSRATAACAAAKALNGSIVTEVLVYSTSNVKLDATLQVSRH